ncbi:MAG: stage II sporulation protein M [Anaerolineae bacterium]|nr:stage II sporulation protein M [Anaerolineae bacterium]
MRSETHVAYTDLSTVLTLSERASASGLNRWWASIRWNMSRALLVTRREVIDMFRDWRILSPIVILTVIFPSIANWGAGQMSRWVAEYGGEIVGDRLIPFLMMVVGFFPISFSLIIALETFVGEKERHSLEPLLSSPLTNTQLYIGKTLSAGMPPLAGSLLGIAVYQVGVYFNVGYVPPLVLIVQVLLLTLLQGLIMVAGAVIVSGQVTSVRAANLLASFIIIPMTFLIQAEAIIMFWARYDTLWAILGGLLVLYVVLVRMGARAFNREEMMGNEIDDLNLLAAIRDWYRLVQARRPASEHRSVWRWYREEVLGAVWQARGGLVIVLCGFCAGAWIGAHYGQLLRIPPELFNLADWESRFSLILSSSGYSGVTGVLHVILLNVRTLAIASALAVFSFGVLLILILMLPFVVVGFLAAQVLAAGLDPLSLWASLLPHSLFEVPAALIAGAVAVRLGACIIAPPVGKTLGQGWLIALADATRAWLGLVLPLLMVGALVEIYVTPRLVLLAVGG